MRSPTSRARLLAEALVPLGLGLLAMGCARPLAGGFLLCLGGALVLAALLAPWIGASLHRGGARLGLHLAEALTWVLLALVHLLVFTPAGLLLRAVGRDPLQRSFPSRQVSCWQPHAPTDPARIRRSF